MKSCILDLTQLLIIPCPQTQTIKPPSTKWGFTLGIPIKEVRKNSLKPVYWILCKNKHVSQCIFLGTWINCTVWRIICTCMCMYRFHNKMWGKCGDIGQDLSRDPIDQLTKRTDIAILRAPWWCGLKKMFYNFFLSLSFLKFPSTKSFKIIAIVHIAIRWIGRNSLSACRTHQGHILFIVYCILLHVGLYCPVMNSWINGDFRAVSNSFPELMPDNHCLSIVSLK